MVEIRYDREADALYVTFIRDVAVARTDQVDDGTLVDVDADGRPIGIEVIRPSRAWALDEVLTRYSVEEDDAVTLRQLFGSPTVA
jgi:uncharacterized protein YuzE